MTSVKSARWDLNALRSSELGAQEWTGLVIFAFTAKASARGTHTAVKLAQFFISSAFGTVGKPVAPKFEPLLVDEDITVVDMLTMGLKLYCKNSTLGRGRLLLIR
jgi:hypothetical protein